MRTAVHITWHGAQINFGDLTQYLTYGRPVYILDDEIWFKDYKNSYISTIFEQNELTGLIF